MPTQNNLGILRDVGVSDNYMPESWSTANAYETFPYPRFNVKLPARIVDEITGGDGSARFEIEHNLFDETEIECTIDNYATIQNPSSGIVTYTSLSSGNYTLKVRFIRDTINFEMEVPFSIYAIGGYGEYYRLLWSDIETGVDWKISIMKKGFSGTFTDISGSGSPVTLTWGEGSSDDLYADPVFNSKCDIQLLVETEGQFDELFNDSDPFKYRIDIYRGTSRYWRGWIADNQYSYPLKDTPYYVNLTATDGFGLLSSKYAGYGDLSGTRARWNHDSIPITELIWAIKREMRFMTTTNPASVNTDTILWQSHMTPEGADTDYPSLFSQTVDLTKFIDQDEAIAETNLMALLTDVLGPTFCRILSYGHKWYVHSNLRYDSGSVDFYEQTWFDTFEIVRPSSLHSTVGGISDTPTPANHWLRNDQTVSFTPIFSSAKLTHSQKKPSPLIWYGPIVRDLVSSTYRKIQNNDHGFFAFRTGSVLPPGPTGNPVIYLRVPGNNVIGIQGFDPMSQPVAAYFGIEPIKFLRSPNALILVRFKIKFRSIYLDIGNNCRLHIQIIAGGFYYAFNTDVVTETDDPEWIAIDLTSTSWTDMNNHVSPDSGDNISKSITDHEIVTLPLPTAILDEEHFTMRVLQTSESTAADWEIFMDNLEIYMEYVSADGDGNYIQVKNAEKKELTVVDNIDYESPITYELTWWTGEDLFLANYAKGNPVSMPDDSPIRSFEYNTLTFNFNDYWCNHIMNAHTWRRKVIQGSINQHIAPYKQPSYRNQDYAINGMTHNLKSFTSQITLVQLPDNYLVGDTLFTIDTNEFENLDWAGGATTFQFRFVGGEYDLINGGHFINFRIDWGDGTIEDISSVGNIEINVSHDYVSHGQRQIRISSTRSYGLVFDATTPFGFGGTNSNDYRTFISGGVVSIDFVGNRCYAIAVDGEFNNVQSVGHIMRPIFAQAGWDISGPGYQFRGNSIPTSNVNDILVQLDTFDLVGYIELDNQSPSAPPSGAGSTAKSNLIASGWSVSTS